MQKNRTGLWKRELNQNNRNKNPKIRNNKGCHLYPQIPQKAPRQAGI